MKKSKCFLLSIFLLGCNSTRSINEIAPKNTVAEVKGTVFIWRNDVFFSLNDDIFDLNSLKELNTIYLFDIQPNIQNLSLKESLNKEMVQISSELNSTTSRRDTIYYGASTLFFRKNKMSIGKIFSPYKMYWETSSNKFSINVQNVMPYKILFMIKRNKDIKPLI